MEYLITKHVPLKYFKDVYINLFSKAWDYVLSATIHKKYYFFNVLVDSTSFIIRKKNMVILTIENNQCIGYLFAYIPSIGKVFHPILFLINIVVTLMLSLSTIGRKIIKLNTVYQNSNWKAVEIANYGLTGINYKKTPIGCSVAVDPDFRKRGIYSNMIRYIFSFIDSKRDGPFIFQTSTESDYIAHEKMGFKHLYSPPFPYLREPFFKEEDELISYIMYGFKEDLKL